MVKKRERFLIDWEEMRLTGKHDPKPPRAQSPEQTEKAEGFTCRWEGCTRVCRSKGGLTQHERRMHCKSNASFKCTRCFRTFNGKAQLTNHSKACETEVQTQPRVWSRESCYICGTKQSKTNMASHLRRIHGVVKQGRTPP